jgi:hypothetical protein
MKEQKDWGNIVFKTRIPLTYEEMTSIILFGFVAIPILIMCLIMLYFGLINNHIFVIILFFPLFIIILWIIIGTTLLLKIPYIIVFQKGIWYPHAYKEINSWKEVFIPFEELIDFNKNIGGENIKFQLITINKIYQFDLNKNRAQQLYDVLLKTRRNMIIMT